MALEDVSNFPGYSLLFELSTIIETKIEFIFYQKGALDFELLVQSRKEEYEKDNLSLNRIILLELVIDHNVADPMID